jgi:hypothetical protein
MKNILRKPFGFGILLAVLLQAGCATTQFNTVWKDNSSQFAPKNILIVGIASEPMDRRILEDEFVKQFKTLGIRAVVSYDILPDEKDGDKDAIAKKVAELGADSVLITRLTDKKSVYVCLAPNNFCPPSYYGKLEDYYWFGAMHATSTDYLKETQYAIMETNLYDAVNDQLAWSASSDTEINGSDRQFIKSYVKAVVKKLSEQNLLKQK